jgi:hypothetical protein
MILFYGAPFRLQCFDSTAFQSFVFQILAARYHIQGCESIFRIYLFINFNDANCVVVIRNSMVILQFAKAHQHIRGTVVHSSEAQGSINVLRYTALDHVQRQKNWAQVVALLSLMLI